MNRLQWLSELSCNSFTLGKNEDHACNHMTAAQWISENPDAFSDTAPAELQHMVDTDTIWRLQIYPDTPIGFYVWYGATLEAVVDAAMQALLSPAPR